MTKRGRKSGASLAIRPVTPIEATPRPAPPDELSDEGAAEWHEIVDCLPADWFTRETQALLVQYCRHIVSARRVAQMIAALEADENLDFKAYHDALKAQQRESGILDAAPLSSSEVALGSAETNGTEGKYFDRCIIVRSSRSELASGA